MSKKRYILHFWTIKFQLKKDLLSLSNKNLEKSIAVVIKICGKYIHYTSPTTYVFSSVHHSIYLSLITKKILTSSFYVPNKKLKALLKKGTY